MQLKQKQAEEAAARDAEAAAKAEARIKAALEANRTILIKRRQDFDAKQTENEDRRRSVVLSLALGSEGRVGGKGGGGGGLHGRQQGSRLVGSRSHA